MVRKGGRVSVEEQKVREHRMRNLDYALKTAVTSPHTLAKKLACDTSYVSQLRNGFRPITSDVARQIEAVENWIRFSLDSPARQAPNVTPVTDSQIIDLIKTRAQEYCKKAGRIPKGKLFDAAVQFCIVDAQERGFSEGRVKHILEEFLK